MITKVVITHKKTGRKEVCTYNDVIGKRTFWKIEVTAPDGTVSHPLSRTIMYQSKFLALCMKEPLLKVEMTQ